MREEFLVAILLIIAFVMGFALGRGTNAFAAELPQDSGHVLLVPSLVEV